MYLAFRPSSVDIYAVRILKLHALPNLQPEEAHLRIKGQVNDNNGIDCLHPIDFSPTKQIDFPELNMIIKFNY